MYKATDNLPAKQKAGSGMYKITRVEAVNRVEYEKNQLYRKIGLFENFHTNVFKFSEKNERLFF
jgi:hypothetical protein